MNSPIRRLTIALLVGFCLLLLNVTYIQAVAADRYRDDFRNSRVQISRAAKERGLILDRTGVVLAASETAQGGVGFDRTYPYRGLLGHPVGSTSLLFGDRGLEAVYAEDLRSKQDLTISDIIAGVLGGDLAPQNLVTTLDVQLQQVAAAALGSQNGAVVAIDPATGAVLAYVSSPGFNPEILVGTAAGPAGDTLDADPDEPLRDRVVDQTYAPGSVFKIVTLASALDSGEFTAESAFEDPVELALPGSESTISNADGQACGDGTSATLATAFVRSCNTVFGQVAMDLGARTMAATAESFGFAAEVPFEFEVRDSVFSSIPLTADLPALAQTSIGQRDVRITPLHMAMVTAAVANGGEMMAPFLVQTVLDSGGEPVIETEPTTWRRAMSESTASIISQLMTDVVNSGTGTAAQVPGTNVAGKTGTAQVPGQPPHAWFVGFAPAEQPTIAIAVIVENGGFDGADASGGRTAAPIAQQVLSAWMELSP